MRNSDAPRNEVTAPTGSTVGGDDQATKRVRKQQHQSSCQCGTRQHISVVLTHQAPHNVRRDKANERNNPHHGDHHGGCCSADDQRPGPQPDHVYAQRLRHVLPRVQRVVGPDFPDEKRERKHNHHGHHAQMWPPSAPQIAERPENDRCNL